MSDEKQTPDTLEGLDPLVFDLDKIMQWEHLEPLIEPGLEEWVTKALRSTELLERWALPVFCEAYLHDTTADELPTVEWQQPEPINYAIEWFRKDFPEMARQWGPEEVLKRFNAFRRNIERPTSVADCDACVASLQALLPKKRPALAETLQKLKGGPDPSHHAYKRDTRYPVLMAFHAETIDQWKSLLLRAVAKESSLPKSLRGHGGPGFCRSTSVQIYQEYLGEAEAPYDGFVGPEALPISTFVPSQKAEGIGLKTNVVAPEEWILPNGGLGWYVRAYMGVSIPPLVDNYAAQLSPLVLTVDVLTPKVAPSVSTLEEQISRVETLLFDTFGGSSTSWPTLPTFADYLSRVEAIGRMGQPHTAMSAIIVRMLTLALIDWMRSSPNIEASPPIVGFKRSAKARSIAWLRAHLRATHPRYFVDIVAPAEAMTRQLPQVARQRVRPDFAGVEPGSLQDSLGSAESNSSLQLPPPLRPYAQRALAYLRAGFHVLLAGVPGTGKTTIAQFVAHAWDNSLDALPTSLPRAELPRTTVANSAWSPFHTIGGLVPAGTPDSFTVAPGVFVSRTPIHGDTWTLYDGALVLDEMNRADLDRCIGDLYPLLSDSVHAVEPAGIPGMARIEANPRFRVLATINDASLDDIVFPISEGLARRFQRIELPGATAAEASAYVCGAASAERSEPAQSAINALFQEQIKDVHESQRLLVGVGWLKPLKLWAEGPLQLPLNGDGDTLSAQALRVLIQALRPARGAGLKPALDALERPS